MAVTGKKKNVVEAHMNTLIFFLKKEIMATIKSIRTRGEGGGNNSKEVSISSPVPQKKRRLRRKLSESEEEEESPLEIKRIIKTAEQESTLIQSSDEEQLAETKAIEDKKAIEVEKEEADKEVSNEGEEKEVEKNNGNAIEGMMIKFQVMIVSNLNRGNYLN